MLKTSKVFKKALKRYRDFSPTAFDSKGLGLDDHQDWVVAPCTVTRDSGALDRANFEAQLEILGGESDTVEVHRFGHWGPGWFEIAIVSPSREAEVEAIEASLADYPVLDEEKHSNLEWTEYQESWDSWGNRELSRFLENKFESELTDEEYNALSEMDLRELYESKIQSGEYYVAEGDSVSLKVDRVAKEITLQDLKQYLGVS